MRLSISSRVPDKSEARRRHYRKPMGISSTPNTPVVPEALQASQELPTGLARQHPSGSRSTRFLSERLEELQPSASSSRKPPEGHSRKGQGKHGRSKS